MKLREIMRLVEAESYPKLVHSSFIDALVQRLHGRSADLDEGDLLHRIDRFATYRLVSIPIADLNLNEFGVDQTEVDAMNRMATVMPPIVFDPIAHSIIDGTHRANAAAQRGISDITAYVGAQLNPDWSEDIEDDE